MGIAELAVISVTTLNYNFVKCHEITICIKHNIHVSTNLYAQIVKTIPTLLMWLRYYQIKVNIFVLLSW